MLLARGSPAAQFSYVTHAGLYVGGGWMVDAVPKYGVRHISVWDLANHRTLEVRRARDFDGNAIAHFALREVGKRYSIPSLIRDGIIKAQPYEEDLTGMYCTQLILRATAITDPHSRNLAESTEHNPFFPAMLVNHPSLDAVHVSWRQCWKSSL